MEHSAFIGDVLRWFASGAHAGQARAGRELTLRWLA